MYYPISAYDKIAIEAPYHALTNAGHISYIEMDGDPTENLGAFERVIRCMKEKGIGYGSVNHPVDRDPVCGFSGIIGDQCPGCGGAGPGEAQRLREAPPLSFVNEMLQKRDLISQVSFFLQVFPAKELRDREKLGGFSEKSSKMQEKSPQIL